MSDGIKAQKEAFDAFATHLDQLEEQLQKSADMVGSCVGDPGIFGIVAGQLYGAGASMHCGKARDHLHDYSAKVKDFSDKVRDAAKHYQEGDEAAKDAITTAANGLGEVEVK
ncbi:type VII secretion target [Amycolatopsis sp. PS_44_ISF1]|uniref:type VII secretion target n=1 Tax=Amycolatopsis sp. PS_44_ISF1 TaxID=2974917 RepID=UPI0028DF81ED|nr:type VII secretion target [Amycolatopsis sp. PS_44_ISF1]MDT8911945.1 type VII secretion target [Amycolatopsis sp. PS_44_ISF1]